MLAMCGKISLIFRTGNRGQQQQQQHIFIFIIYLRVRKIDAHFCAFFVCLKSSTERRRKKKCVCVHSLLVFRAK